MGSFALGQDMNDVILNCQKNPEFFPSDSLIKNKKINHVFEYSYNESGLVSKMDFKYDIEGKRLYYNYYKGEDTNSVFSNSTYLYEKNRIIIIDSGTSFQNKFERQDKYSYFFDSRNNDTCIIDSLFNHGIYCCFSKSIFISDIHKNVIKETYIFSESPSKSGKNSQTMDIIDHYYDKKNRIVKVIHKDFDGKEKDIETTYYTYINDSVVKRKEKGDYAFGEVNLIFDSQKRLTKYIYQDTSNKDGFSLYYDAEKLIRWEDNYGSKSEYYYLDELPFKIILYLNNRKETSLEYRYEFY